MEDIKNNISNTINIEIEWKDNTENSQEDIELGTINNYKFKVPVVVKVSQYTGENIEEFKQEN